MTQTDLPVQPEFSHFVNCGRLPSRGKAYEFEANSDERKALAERMSIVSLDLLRVEFSVTPGPGDVIFLSGRVEAKIKQTCVISLTPIVSDINITVERTYSESADPFSELGNEPDEDGYIDKEILLKKAPNPLEPLENGGVDLGEVASEELAVAIDPFPRLPGAELTINANIKGQQQNEEVKNPFAVLEKLKKKLE